MEYKVVQNTAVIRLECGEEIIKCIENVCTYEKINLATVTGIGTVDHIVLGFYNVEQKKYFSRTFDESLEINSITGNITEKENHVYLHIHGVFSNINCEVYGGHLNEAIVGATCEIFINILNGKLERIIDKNIGFNVLKF